MPAICDHVWAAVSSGYWDRPIWRRAFGSRPVTRADCGFADRLLCGTGVAFFLLVATWRRLKQAGCGPDFDLRQLLDRVAVATVADVMKLAGVNRILVHHGLAQLNTQPSTGMAALLAVARVKSAVTTETIGFHIAPRINAAGRMRHGEEAMRLLSTIDAGEAADLASVLDESNKQRNGQEGSMDVHWRAPRQAGRKECFSAAFRIFAFSAFLVF